MREQAQRDLSTSDLNSETRNSPFSTIRNAICAEVVVTQYNLMSLWNLKMKGQIKKNNNELKFGFSGPKNPTVNYFQTMYVEIINIT